MSTLARHVTRPAAPALDWDKGACTRRVDDLFFPSGESEAARAQADRAKLICARCPIRQACLSWALANREDQGVWGGLTPKERRTLHRRKTPWGSTRGAADRIYASQLGEFTALLDRGLAPLAIAQALRTNVQTVNTVMSRINAAQTVQEVAVV
jgi:WhiB family redox-sensing transcriptional regulator